MRNDNPFQPGNNVIPLNVKDLKGGGGDGTFDDMEARVKRLEEDMTEIRKDLRSILLDTSEIKGKLSNMPSAADFGELKGRVSMLPTTAKVAGVFSVVGGIVTVVIKWAEISAVFGY